MGGALSIRQAQVTADVIDGNKAGFLGAEKLTVNGSLCYVDDIRSTIVLNAVGEKYELGEEVPADFALAARCYQRAAEQEHPVAQFNLGSMYTFGRGAENDFVQAEWWYRKSADQGMPHAQCNLGHMYLNGVGVENNWTTAMEWFLLSAKQGHERAADAVEILKART